MIKCGWCGTDTLQIYTLKDGKSLCPECADKHYQIVVDKMTNHIQEIHNGLKNKADNLRRLKQQMCKHKNLINTNYCKIFSPKVVKTIFRCEDCGKQIYRQSWESEFKE